MSDEPISIVFTNTNKETINKISLLKTHSHSIFYQHFIHTCKWLDNDVFQLSNKHKEVNIRINVDGRIAIDYAPKDRDSEGIKQEIRFFTRELFFPL